MRFWLVVLAAAVVGVASYLDDSHGFAWAWPAACGVLWGIGVDYGRITKDSRRSGATRRRWHHPAPPA